MESVRPRAEQALENQNGPLPRLLQVLRQGRDLLTQTWGYYCLNHDVRFRPSSFTSALKAGMMPCKCPIWGCGFFVYSQRYAGNPEVCFNIRIERVLTTGQHEQIYERSDTISNQWNQVDMMKSWAAHEFERGNVIAAEYDLERAKALENALSGQSLTGWRRC